MNVFSLNFHARFTTLTTRTLLLIVVSLSFGACEKKVALKYKEEGMKIPDLTLADLEGKELTLSHFEGKIVFLHFWSSWCTNCEPLIKPYNDIYKKYHPLGLEIIGVAAIDSKKNVREFIKKYKIKYPVVISNEVVNDSYLNPILPTSFILGKDGTLISMFKDTKKEDLDKIREKVELLTSI